MGRGFEEGLPEAVRSPLAAELTWLDLAFALRQLLEVADDGAGRQVVEGLAPQVGVVCPSPLRAGGPQLKGHFPLQTLTVPQALDHGLA